jgi:hypothetical protein
MVTTKQILKAVACPYLRLVHIPDGYYLFVYHHPERNIYETQSVYVYALNRMTLEQWVDEAQSFIHKMGWVA